MSQYGSLPNWVGEFLAVTKYSIYQDRTQQLVIKLFFSTFSFFFTELCRILKYRAIYLASQCIVIELYGTNVLWYVLNSLPIPNPSHKSVQVSNPYYTVVLSIDVHAVLPGCEVFDFFLMLNICLLRACNRQTKFQFLFCPSAQAHELFIVLMKRTDIFFITRRQLWTLQQLFLYYCIFMIIEMIQLWLYDFQNLTAHFFFRFCPTEHFFACFFQLLYSCTVHIL